jgi:hypothetical protein
MYDESHSSVVQLTVNSWNPYTPDELDVNGAAQLQKLRLLRNIYAAILAQLTADRVSENGYGLILQRPTSWDNPRVVTADQNVRIILLNSPPADTDDTVEATSEVFEALNRVSTRLSHYPVLTILLVIQPDATAETLCNVSLPKNAGSPWNYLQVLPNVPLRQGPSDTRRSCTQLINMITNWVHGLRYNPLVYNIHAANQRMREGKRPDVLGNPSMVLGMWQRMQCHAPSPQFTHISPHTFSDTRHLVYASMASIGAQFFCDDEFSTTELRIVDAMLAPFNTELELPAVESRQPQASEDAASEAVPFDPFLGEEQHDDRLEDIPEGDGEHSEAASQTQILENVHQQVDRPATPEVTNWSDRIRGALGFTNPFARRRSRKTTVDRPEIFVDDAPRPADSSQSTASDAQATSQPLYVEPRPTSALDVRTPVVSNYTPSAQPTPMNNSATGMWVGPNMDVLNAMLSRNQGRQGT